ncbi:MAG: AI-2E family transporter [Candidatus Gastranaerophilales bacterium]|nr:AI-2E family transporter [Candidatus Gastranaerophilales bacterium]
MNTVKSIISTKSILLFFALAILTMFIYQIKDVLLLLFASFIIASALFPTVDWMSKKMPRGFAVFIVYTVGLIIIATVLIPFFSILFEQTQEFLKQAPSYWVEIKKFILHIQIISKHYGMLPDASQIFASTSNLSEKIVSQSINITIGLFTGVIAAFTLAVLVLFLLLDRDELKEGFLKFFPEHMRNRTENITATIAKKVGGYVRGQILLMFMVGLFTALGLFILDIKFALLLGLIAGVLEIIPIVGPIFSAIPAIVVALAQDPILVVWVILVYLIVQRVENTFLTPLILGKFLELNPLIIIIAILIAASTLGVTGVILAPPIAASICVLVQELYINRINQPKESF